TRRCVVVVIVLVAAVVTAIGVTTTGGVAATDSGIEDDGDEVSLLQRLAGRLDVRDQVGLADAEGTFPLNPETLVLQLLYHLVDVAPHVVFFVERDRGRRLGGSG